MNLTCNNCGNPIMALATNSDEVWIECENIACGASWNAHGGVEFPGFESEKK